MQNLEGAEELLNDTTSKLQDALSSKALNKIMLKSVKGTCKEVMD